MISLVALCADEVSLAHPELIGLEGEQLAAQSWLRLFSSGIDMRTFLAGDRLVDEAWVVSADDVEPINLAASIKSDRPDLRVCLITFQGTGSLRSRASASGIDATLTHQAFVTRYAALKRVRSEVTRPLGGGAASGRPSPGSGTQAPSPYDSGSLFQPEEPVLSPPKPQRKHTASLLPEVGVISPSHSGLGGSAAPQSVASRPSMPGWAGEQRDPFAPMFPQGFSHGGPASPAGQPSPAQVRAQMFSGQQPMIQPASAVRSSPAYAGAPVPPPGYAGGGAPVPSAGYASACSAPPAGCMRVDAPPAPAPDTRASSVSAPGGQPAFPTVGPQALSAMRVTSTSAFILPVISGSGGAGKSTVAALSAFLSQRRGLKTLLLDFDLQFGDMRETSGAVEAVGIDELLADPTRISQLAAPAGLPSVLGAPRHLEESEAIAAQAPALLDALSTLYDVIIANTGAAWAEQHAVLLERCTKALFLIDQRSSSIVACRRALDLCARCGIAVGPILFALNFCAKGAPLTSIDVTCALRGSPTVELVDGGAEVEEALSEGRPQDLIESGNPLASSLDELLAGILPAPDDPNAVAPAPVVHGSRFRRRRKRRKGGTL